MKKEKEKICKKKMQYEGEEGEVDEQYVEDGEEQMPEGELGNGYIYNQGEENGQENIESHEENGDEGKE